MSLLLIGLRGIFVPIKNHLEQEENARRLGYRYEDIFRLESLVEEKIITIKCNRHNLNACNNLDLQKGLAKLS